MAGDDAAYVIRTATEDDRTGVLHCLAVAFEPYRADYTPEAYADTVLDAVGYERRLKTMHVIVAISKSGVAGTISGVRNGNAGHLRGMAVLPECKGTGLAGRMLSSMENWMKEQGCTRVTLNTTVPLKTAARFYVKAGYRESGKTSDFFGMPLLGYFKEL